MPDEMPASLRARAAAFARDYLVILAYIAVITPLSLLIFTLRPAWRAAIFPDAARADIFAFLILVFPVILYGAFCESSARQATWGKRRGGLRVRSVNGARVGLGRALLRNALKYLPWQIAHTSIFHVNALPQLATVGFYVSLGLVGLYLLLIGVTRDHRAPYDWLAGTQVTHSTLGKID